MLPRLQNVAEVYARDSGAGVTILGVRGAALATAVSGDVIDFNGNVAGTLVRGISNSFIVGSRLEAGILRIASERPGQRGVARARRRPWPPFPSGLSIR